MVHITIFFNNYSFPVFCTDCVYLQTNVCTVSLLMLCNKNNNFICPFYIHCEASSINPIQSLSENYAYHYTRACFINKYLYTSLCRYANMYNSRIRQDNLWVIQKYSGILHSHTHNTYLSLSFNNYYISCFITKIWM